MHAMRRQEEDDDGFDDEDEADGEPAGRLLGQKELKKVFRRSFFSMTTINYERYCSLGFCYA